MDSEIKEYIWNLVRFGFDDETGIIEQVDDTFMGEDYNRSSMLEYLHSELENRKTEEEKWIGVTDFEKISKCFDKLISTGIICLHNAGYTQSDGYEGCVDIFHEAGGDNSIFRGYCFYQQQDLEGLLPHFPSTDFSTRADLYLAFGDIKGDEINGLTIGHEIQRTFEQNGLQIEWDGTFKKRILVKNIEWKKKLSDESWHSTNILKKNRSIQILNHKPDKKWWRFW